MRHIAITVLLAACGPGLGTAEFARTSTKNIANHDVANDLRLMLDSRSAELSLCGDPFRARVRQGDSGDVQVTLYALGVPGQSVKISYPEVVSSFGPAYNLCALEAIRGAKLVSSGAYDAHLVLHWTVAPDKGPP